MKWWQSKRISVNLKKYNIAEIYNNDFLVLHHGECDEHGDKCKTLIFGIPRNLTLDRILRAAIEHERTWHSNPRWMVWRRNQQRS